MLLSDIIPNSDPKWVIKGNFLMYKKYQNKPIAYIEANFVFIYLDFTVIKPISKLVSFLMKSGIKFLFKSPEMSNPSHEDDYVKNVTHYLYSHALESVRNEFQKIEFDLIENMVKYCEKYNCDDLIKPCYELVKKITERGYHDYYSNKFIYDYDESVREDFRNLYRDIQISRII